MPLPLALNRTIGLVNATATGILGSDKTVVSFSYFTRVLYEMQASIQLIIVTAGPSLIDSFKTLLAETGAKKDNKNIQGSKHRHNCLSCLPKLSMF